MEPVVVHYEPLIETRGKASEIIWSLPPRYSTLLCPLLRAPFFSLLLFCQFGNFYLPVKNHNFLSFPLDLFCSLKICNSIILLRFMFVIFIFSLYFPFLFKIELAVNFFLAFFFILHGFFISFGFFNFPLFVITFFFY